MSDPGLEIDAIFETSPKTLAAIHMGYNSIKEMEIQKFIKLMGEPAIIDNAQFWIETIYFGESSKSKAEANSLEFWKSLITDF